MLSPADTKRRCAFKLLRNDKYQCQKTGDKYQPHIELYYCRFHDRYEHDRCQVLVTWAGKGARCEQLGVFDEESKMRLCEWHATKSKEEDWPEMQDAPSVMQDVPSVTKEDGWEETAAAEGADEKSTRINEVSPELTSLAKAMTIEDQMDLLTRAATKPRHPLNTDNLFLATTPQDQILPTEADDNTVTATTPTTSAHTGVGNTTSILPLPPSTLISPTLHQPPATPCNLARTPHKRTDSLNPSPSTPNTTRTPPTPSPSTPLQAHIAFLNQETTNPSRIAAMYAQCCVCLEKHGEGHMERVEECGHWYRELCARKAVKVGGRRWNCGGCWRWMSGRWTETDED